jgi:hypothetical protein
VTRMIGRALTLIGCGLAGFAVAYWLGFGEFYRIAMAIVFTVVASEILNFEQKKEGVVA